MKTYIALLRGINVAGKNLIKMPDLVEIFVSMKFQNVKTYLQSGNVVFEAPDQEAADLEALIERTLKKELALNVPTLIRTQKELDLIVKANPHKEFDPAFLHVTFLAEKSKAEIPTSMGVDAVQVKNREVYLYCPGGYGKTKFSNIFIEKKLQTKATTRNWKTVCALQEMAKI